MGLHLIPPDAPPSAQPKTSASLAVKPAGGAQPPARHRRFLPSYRFWFALPAVAMMLFFFGLPFVANAVLSFTKWTGFSNTIKFYGFSNFVNLAKLGILGHATLVTVLFAVTTMAGQNVVALLLSKALQETNRTNSIFRSIYFIPVLISPLAAGYIWGAILSAHGPINAAISWFSPGFTYNWLGHTPWALLFVGLIDAWKWSGLVTLVYIAGLNSINKSVIEASILDGTTAWQRFRRIEMPLLAPSFTFNIVITLVGSFNALDVIFATTKGGPGNATSVLNAAVFAQYGEGLFSSSSALSFMIALLVIIVAIPLLTVLRKREMAA